MADASKLGLIAGTNLPAGPMVAALVERLGATATVDTVEVTGRDGPITIEVTEVGPMAVLVRHSSRGFVPAHLVDHVANLRALADRGVQRAVGVCSAGALRTNWSVGTVVVPDDFFAPAVTPTIHDDDAGHTVPSFDTELRAGLITAWRASVDDRPIVDGGTYAQTTGPRFETPAEVRFLASVADLVGMTAASECILAGELGVAYATLCQVDNLANGIDGSQLHREDLAAVVDEHAERLVDDVADAVVALVTR